MSEYCKYCGQAYGDARTLLLNTSTRHPGGRYLPFEGEAFGHVIKETLRERDRCQKVD